MDLNGLFNLAEGWLGRIVTILIALAVAVVILTALRFAFTKDAAKRNEFRNQMIAAIIAVAVIFSIYGIVRILQRTVFGGGTVGNSANQQNLQAPTLGL